MPASRSPRRSSGSYAALVYRDADFGGIVADRWLGRAATVTIGAILMAIGHFLMAFEMFLLASLACLLAGVGCFKGNIASQVGELYGPERSAPGDAFQIFYSPSTSRDRRAARLGTLGEKVGWHWGFGAAGVVMVIGLAIYLAGQ